MDKIQVYPLPCKSVVAGKFATRFRLGAQKDERMSMTDFN